MTIHFFNYLRDLQKEEVLLDDGVFVTTIKLENVTCHVYMLYDFHVSVAYQIGVNRSIKISTSMYLEDLPEIKTMKKVVDQSGVSFKLNPGCRNMPRLNAMVQQVTAFPTHENIS